MIVKPGDVYSRLTVVGVIPGVAGNCERMVLCKCECGARKIAKSGNIRNGHTKSCGCYRREFMKTHGHASSGTQTPEYRSWSHMISRCEDESFRQYDDYGGRGISVCDRWRVSFEEFLRDMGNRPAGTSIDRIDNEGNYEPGNCRWATRAQQNSNRRRKQKARV